MSASGKICAAFGCNNYDRNNKGLSFFRFPKEKDRYVIYVIVVSIIIIISILFVH
jgi:hypothetical protein